MTAKRTPKTPRQRAEDRLGIATRKVTKLTNRKTTLTTELRDVERELASEQQRLDHAKTDPDLPPAAPATTSPKRPVTTTKDTP